MHVPGATYRVQFTPDFGFDQARRLVPYLSRLGMGALYASPVLSARAGSVHGYDVVDPGRLNPALGSRADFNALVAELHIHAMRLILDTVPMHMAASAENGWWTDVLEHGPDSPYATMFDIDWHRSPDGAVSGARVPERRSEVRQEDTLENQELRVDVADGTLVRRCDEHRLPLSPSTYAPVLHRACERLGPRSDLADRAASAFEVLSAKEATRTRPPRGARTSAGLPPDRDDGHQPELLRFVRRWQQLTGPVTAKGVGTRPSTSTTG